MQRKISQSFFGTDITRTLGLPELVYVSAGFSDKAIVHVIEKGRTDCM